MPLSTYILIAIDAVLCLVTLHLYRLLHYERMKNRYLLRSCVDLQARCNQYDKLFKAIDHRKESEKENESRADHPTLSVPGR